MGKLAELADSGVSITWVTGNHDVWLFDYLRDQIGLTVLNGHTVVEAQGKRILISHGDDVGVHPVMYRFTRWCFYNKVCQWLYAAIHPRWTHPIATGWSIENRTRRNPEQQRDISGAKPPGWWTSHGIIIASTPMLRPLSMVTSTSPACVRPTMACRPSSSWVSGFRLTPMS